MPPIRLRTIGTLDVAGPDAPGLDALVSQHKRAALVVYLAVACTGMRLAELSGWDAKGRATGLPAHARG